MIEFQTDAGKYVRRSRPRLENPSTRERGRTAQIEHRYDKAEN
jgi:hypothetical protein